MLLHGWKTRNFSLMNSLIWRSQNPTFSSLFFFLALDLYIHWTLSTKNSSPSIQQNIQLKAFTQNWELCIWNGSAFNLGPCSSNWLESRLITNALKRWCPKWKSLVGVLISVPLIMECGDFSCSYSRKHTIFIC